MIFVHILAASRKLPIRILDLHRTAIRNFESIFVAAGDKPDIFSILQLRISLFHLPKNLSAASYLFQHLQGYRSNGKTGKTGNLLECCHPRAFFQRRKRLFIQHIPANVSFGGLHLTVHIKAVELHAVLLFLQGKQSSIIHQISCIHHFHAHFLPPNSSLNAAAPSSPVSTRTVVS